MTNLDDELKSLVALYGQAIPPLPRGASQVGTIWQLSMDATLYDYAGKVASDPRFKYGGDIKAVVRHALSLFLMALAQSVKDQSPGFMFQMEALRRKQEEDGHKEFVDYAGAQIKAAGRCGPMSSGRRTLLVALIKSARTARAVQYLIRHGEFRRLAQASGDEELQAWLVILS